MRDDRRCFLDTRVGLSAACGAVGRSAGTAEKDGEAGDLVFAVRRGVSAVAARGLDLGRGIRAEKFAMGAHRGVPPNRYDR